jgi:4-hydroxy-3-methylbut-2-en-1-yl diphosphate reductase
MTAGLVCAPSRLESAALQGALQGRPVHRIGVGRAAAIRSARSPALREAAGLVLAGIAGGLSPALATGDVVVASEVRGGGGTVACPSSPILAAELRRAGLRVHVGPVLSADHVVAGTEREALAASGALCVDMESAYLLANAAPDASAVVRVIADVAGSPLLRPATAGRMATALSVLRRLGPALGAWADAAGPRHVQLASPRSFCAGVVRAIDIVERALELRDPPVYVRKQIVHNVHVVADLTERGAVFVDELEDVPSGATVVFSAHGVSPAVRAEAVRRNLEVIDATCPLVRKVHSEVRRFADDGDTVIFLGHAGHEETEGTMGERPERTVLVETPEDARTVAIADPDRVSYVVQTTLAADEVAELVDILEARFPAIRQPPADDICYATTNRQEAVSRIADGADLALVLGSANSSNSRRLVERAERLGTPAHLIDDASGIELAWLAGAEAVALTAGASAPAALVDGVLAALRGLGPLEIDESPHVEEPIRFTLPKEVRNA